MPRQADLPSAEELYDKLTSGPRVEALTRPPWSAVSSPDLCHDWLGIHPNTAAAWRYKRIGPEPEPHPARSLYRRAGVRVLYRFEAVLSWLDGDPTRPPHYWARRWFHDAYLSRPVADDPAAVLSRIRDLEGRGTHPRRWRWRTLDRGLARLAACYGAPS